MKPQLNPDLIYAKNMYPICMCMQFLGCCRNTVKMLMDTGQLEYHMKRRGAHGMVRVVRGSELRRYLQTSDPLKFY